MSKETVFIDRTRVEEMYVKGHNAKRMARELNLSYSTFLARFKKWGFQVHNRILPARPVDDLSNFLALPEITEEDFSGLPIKQGHVYHIYENFFDIIDTQEKAYLLGMYYADGNVCIRKGYGIACQLGSTDKEIVQNAKNLFQHSGNITCKILSNGKEFYNLYVSNSKICHDLIKHGCVPKKSLILNFPSKESIPEHLMNHFIRGYFDGDGSIYKCTPRGRGQEWGIALVGTDEVMDGILTKCPVIHNRNYPREGKNTCVIMFTKHTEIEKFITYLYKDATIGLRRKAVLAEECLQYIYERSL